MRSGDLDTNGMLANMDQLSDAAEVFLSLLIEEYACELGNHAIHSTHACKHPSASAAMRAMLREAYQRGREDVIVKPIPDYEAAVASVEAVNNANAERG
jgi:hypothetical protein